MRSSAALRAFPIFILLAAAMLGCEPLSTPSVSNETTNQTGQAEGTTTTQPVAVQTPVQLQAPEPTSTPVPAVKTMPDRPATLGQGPFAAPSLPPIFLPTRTPIPAAMAAPTPDPTATQLPTPIPASTPPATSAPAPTPMPAATSAPTADPTSIPAPAPIATPRPTTASSGATSGGDHRIAAQTAELRDALLWIASFNNQTKVWSVYDPSGTFTPEALRRNLPPDYPFGELTQLMSDYIYEMALGGDVTFQGQELTEGVFQIVWSDP